MTGISRLAGTIVQPEELNVFLSVFGSAAFKRANEVNALYYLHNILVEMEVARLGNVSLKEEYLMKLWESYIIEHIVDAGPCVMGVFDRKTKRMITASEGFNILPGELDQIVDGITYPDLIYRNGVTVKGRTYNVQLADGKFGIYARTDGYGCTICRTHTLVLIVTNDESASSSKCNELVMKLGDFLYRAEL